MLANSEFFSHSSAWPVGLLFDHVSYLSNGTNQESQANKSTVRCMLHLRRYDFNMLHLRSVPLFMMCSEAWTTKCCGSWGRIHHDIGGANTFDSVLTSGIVTIMVLAISSLGILSNMWEIFHNIDQPNYI